MSFTKERKQQFLNIFIERVNGKGQAYKNGSCKLVLEGHPGCAIGCQPEFEPFKQEVVENSIRSLGVWSIFSEKRNNIGNRLREAFGIEGTCEEVESKSLADLRFLASLQGLHDDFNFWDRQDKKRLVKAEVDAFCLAHDLDLPEADYA